MENIIFNIANDFTDTPGPRLIKEGEYSGELFLKDILYPKFIEAKQNSVKLIIQMDGTFGYPPSFIDEAFGGLVFKTKCKVENILKTLELKCSRRYYIDQAINRMMIWQQEHNI